MNTRQYDDSRTLEKISNLLNTLLIRIGAHSCIAPSPESSPWSFRGVKFESRAPASSNRLTTVLMSVCCDVN